MNTIDNTNDSATPTIDQDPVKALITSRPGFNAVKPAQQTSATKINDFIYMSEGTSNAYMVTTSLGRVIINTGMGFEALTHKKVFDQVCAGPTPYILLTQGHVDHVGGVKQFKTPETQVIAQQNNAECQRDDERIKTVRVNQAYIWFQQVIDNAISIAASNPEVLLQDKPAPDITFEDKYRIELGGIEFELMATPGGETIDSCVIWLPQHKILFSGNVFGPLFPHFPNINTLRGDKYRFLEPYLMSLNRVKELEPELLITGHFSPIEGKELIRSCLDRLEQAVTFVHRQTLAGMSEGKDIWTLMREVKLPAELQVGEGYGQVSWAVRTLWESYMGWFKARHTSELYPTQAHDIYAELVNLAGIDAVIELARKKLSTGETEKALHLAEAALTSQADNKKALELTRDVHLALLERVHYNNFWEKGWLETQLKKIDAALGGRV